MKLNINEFRKIAGLSPVVESDDDDLSPSEKALIDKADKDLAKKGIKVANVDADKDLEHISRSKDVQNADDKDEPAKDSSSKKSTLPPKTSGEKADEQPVPAQKSREKARAWLNTNPNATRKEFMAKINDFGMGKFNAGNFWQGVKSKKPITEGYYFTHPATKSFMLGENREMNQYVWIDPTISEFPIVIAETKEEADKIEKYLTEFKGQRPVVTYFDHSVD